MQLRMQIPDFRNANFLDIRIWKIVHVNPYGLAHVFDFQDAKVGKKNKNYKYVC